MTFVMVASSVALLAIGSPWSDLGLLVIGVVALLHGADWLVDGAVSIARSMRVSTLFIGLTVVAFGTSAPELVVNIIAVINGHAEISFGNIVGSNLANIGLVVSIGALVRPIVVHSKVVTRELPWLIFVSLGMVGLAYWLKIPVADGEDVPGFVRYDGIILIGAFCCFTFLWYRAAKRDTDDPLALEMAEVAEEDRKLSPLAGWAFTVVGLAALLAGGQATEHGAYQLALWWGWSEAVIGMTIVALATSLPELVTVIVAARRNHADLAVGNVVGSNMFNIMLVLGLTSIIGPVPVPADEGAKDLAVMIFLTLLLLALVVSRSHRVNRLEGGLLLLLYLVYLSDRSFGVLDLLSARLRGE